ncbi:unnamed protein product [Peniophora sp. CBMAI 1063]|nr:unnamed protein product [Peniophora sp. CBMAI 1063]
MDYIFGCALGFLRCASVVVSYDIACQWSINLEKRLSRVPGGRALSAGAAKFVSWIKESGPASTLLSKVKYAVPKFHLYAHKVACQVRWSFMWLVGAGATDGEGLSLLKDWMVRAVQEVTQQCVIHTELTEAICSEAPEMLSSTEARVSEWELDNTKPSPYHIEKERLSVAQIRLETAKVQGSSVEKVARNVNDGRGDSDSGGAASEAMEDEEQNAVDLTNFILHGLDIEEEQAKLSSNRATAGGGEEDSGTKKQMTSRTQALNNLVRMIVEFCDMQERMMPATYAALTCEQREPDRTTALKVKLHLPSQPPHRMSMENTSSTAARNMEVKI